MSRRMTRQVPTIILEPMEHGDGCPVEETRTFGSLAHRESRPRLEDRRDRSRRELLLRACDQLQPGTRPAHLWERPAHRATRVLAKTYADPDGFHRHNRPRPTLAVRSLATVALPCFLPVLVWSESEPPQEYELVGSVVDHQANQRANRVREKFGYDPGAVTYERKTPT